jgi:paraquat-inducible protein B
LAGKVILINHKQLGSGLQLFLLEKFKLNQENGETVLLRNIPVARPTSSTVQQELQNISIHFMIAAAC